MRTLSQEVIVRNMRVGSLKDILSAVNSPIWIKTREGAVKVKTVQAASYSDLIRPDLALLGADDRVLAEFSDQRVKLDLDRRELVARNLRGQECILALSDVCATAP